MHSPIYVLIWVIGASALWVFWNQAVKHLLLDLFRERLFEMRFALFRLGMTGKLDYNSDVYRQLEMMLCGLLRFGHRVTFLTFIGSKIEQDRAKQDKDYVDVSQQLSLGISRLEPEVQAELNRIVMESRRAIYLYMSFTSLFFLAAFLIVGVPYLLGIWKPRDAERISTVVEREAYRAEAKRDIANNISLSAAAI